MASTFPPGPTIFSHFLIFSLLSSPRSMKSCWCYTPKHVFLSPFWSAQLLSTVFLFPSSKLFSKEFSMSLFWFKMDWKTRWNKKRSFPNVHARKKKEEKMTQKSLLRTFLIFIQTEKKKTTSISCHFTYFSLVNFIDIFLSILT